MKKRILRLLCIICAAITLSAQLVSVSYAAACDDEGKMNSMYGYVVNDYLRTYGVISDKFPSGSLGSDEPTGIIYGDTVILDPDEPPYLIIYLIEGKYNIAACHIWKYDNTKQKAERIAIIKKDRSKIDGVNGVFSLGWTENKKYIIYKEYDGATEALVNSEFYTVVGTDTFRYVNDPAYINESGIVDFNKDNIHADINISNGNHQLSVFFDGLKNSASESIKSEDFADSLGNDDENKIETCIKRAALFRYFDISDYGTRENAEKALQTPDTDNKFYLISHIYKMGDEIYYVCFSTDKSYYNYAILRKTDTTDNGYQFLRIVNDGIPLCCSDLNKIKDSYMTNNLLAKKSGNTLKAQSAPKQTKEPKIKVSKILGSNIRKPAAIAGCALLLLLLVILFVKLFKKDKQ